MPPKRIYLATNDSDSLLSFEERREYRDTAIPDGFVNQFIDIWYDKPFYGKVNEKNKPIFLSESNLKQLNTNNDTLFAIDFVADAFKALQTYFIKAGIQRKIKKSGKLFNIEPTTAWQSVSELHHQAMTILYNLFVTMFLKQENREEKILTFKDFVDMLLKFIEDNSVIVSRTAYILSKECPIHTSGLIIDIQDDDAGNDMIKQTEYIDDVNFEFYRNAAHKFGFFIDKNAPWRLVANISSPAMQRYAEKYGLTPSPGSSGELFELYYYKAIDVDINILKSYFSQFWISYAQAYPEVKIVKHCKDGTKTTKVALRKFSDNEKEDDDAYWLKVYFKIRALEEGKKWSEKVFDKKVKTAIILLKSVDMQRALKYIQAELN